MTAKTVSSKSSDLGFLPVALGKTPCQSTCIPRSPNTRLVKSAVRTSKYTTRSDAQCRCDEAERNRRYLHDGDPRHQPLDVRVNEDGEVSCRFCWDLIEPLSAVERDA